MNKREAVEHLQKRLAKMNGGDRVAWSLEDRAAVSLLCIGAAQQPRAGDVCKTHAKDYTITLGNGSKICSFCGRTRA